MDGWELGVVSATQCRSRTSDWKVLRSLGGLLYGIGLDLKKKTPILFLSFFFLQEADWTDVNTKFLIGSTNVHRSNVNDGQARGLL